MLFKEGSWDYLLTTINKINIVKSKMKIINSKETAIPIGLSCLNLKNSRIMNRLTFYSSLRNNFLNKRGSIMISSRKKWNTPLTFLREAQSRTPVRAKLIPRSHLRTIINTSKTQWLNPHALIRTALTNSLAMMRRKGLRELISHI